MTGPIGRWILILLALVVFGACSPSLAAKRRPNGCDWIGGDFAEPGEVLFNTGCRAGVRRAAPRVVAPVDQPPRPIDRPDARAPANYGATTRKKIGAPIQSFQIVGSDIAYGVDGGGRLWRFTLGTTQSAQIAQSVRQFRVTDTGAVYVLESDGTLWRSKGDGAERAFIDHQVADFQPVGDLVYVMGEDKRLWRLHSDGKTRDLVDETVSAFKAIDAASVFVLGTDSALWRESGDFHNRVNIGKPIAAFDYVADGDATYVLAPNHILWRKSGQDAPQQVDHDVAAFHPVDKDLVYVLATDGRLWQELGERGHAALVDGDLALKSGAAAFQFVGPGDREGEAIYLLDRSRTLWAETMPSAHGGVAAKP